MRDDDNLVLICESLRSAAPETWGRFVSAMRDRAADRSAALVRCDPVRDRVMVLKGQAAEADLIVKLLENAPKEAQKIISAAQARR
jgi:hypothetical protein